MPNGLPPWAAVDQQAQCRLRVDVFEASVSHVRVISRLAKGRNASPPESIVDGDTLQSSHDSSAGAGYVRFDYKRGSKLHLAVKTSASWWPCASLRRMSKTRHRWTDRRNVFKP